MKKLIHVDKTFNGMRIDRFLRNQFGQIPQSLIEKNLRNGKIKLNKKKIKSSKKIQFNDKIELFNFEFKQDVKDFLALCAFLTALVTRDAVDASSSIRRSLADFVWFLTICASSWATTQAFASGLPASGSRRVLYILMVLFIDVAVA